MSGNTLAQSVIVYDVLTLSVGHFLFEDLELSYRFVVVSFKLLAYALCYPLRTRTL